MSKIAGVVGSKGDLGLQVVGLLKEQGFEVLENDISIPESLPIDEMLSQADVIHFCIPADAVPGLPATDTLLILHDSVMGSSHTASIEQTNGAAVPVHMLMNAANTVIIASDFIYSQEAAHHFAVLQQRPIFKSVPEHDRLMARTQAPLVILIQELLPDLRNWNEQNLLTPSAVELLESLESREARWTPATTRSILKNTEIDILIDDMRKRRTVESEHSLLNE